MKIIIGLIPLCMLATSAAAELRPAPDYYLETLMELSFADQYSTACDTLDINQGAMGSTIDWLMSRLLEDGFKDPTRAHEEMELPSQEETDAIVLELIERHDTTEDPNASWCEEGRLEIENETNIGLMLMEVSE